MRLYINFDIYCQLESVSTVQGWGTASYPRVAICGCLLTKRVLLLLYPLYSRGIHPPAPLPYWKDRHKGALAARSGLQQQVLRLLCDKREITLNYE